MEEKPLFNETAIELRRSSSSGSSGATRVVEDDDLGFYKHGIRQYGLRDYLSLRNCIAATARFGLATARFAVPSFLRPQEGPSHKRIGGLAALDGLRGLACLSVSTYHFLEMVFTKESVNGGYFWNPEEPGGGGRANFWQWPFVKVLYAGPNMVSIFFVISGYVLSHRMLSLIQQGRVDSALSAMSSSVFRRWMRLFLPLIAMNIFIEVLLQAGAYNFSGNLLGGRDIDFPHLCRDAREQYHIFWNWWNGMMREFFYWKRYGHCNMDCNHWTIPVELRCSMILFLSAVGLARVKVVVRLGVLGLLAALAIHSRLWEVTVFLIGMFVAQVDVVNAAKKSQITIGSQESRRQARWKWAPVIIAAVYFCSVPRDLENAGGYRWLQRHDYFEWGYIFNTWNTIGSALMIVLATNCDMVINLLNKSSIRYLGRVSYALYLVHGTLLRLLLGYHIRMYDRLQRYPDQYDYRAQILSGIGYYIMFIPSLIVLSDMFTRAIDEPSVNLTKRFWDWSLVQS